MERPSTVAASAAEARSARVASPDSLTRRWVTSRHGVAHRGGDVLALGGERVGGGVGALGHQLGEALDLPR